MSCIWSSSLAALCSLHWLVHVHDTRWLLTTNSCTRTSTTTMNCRVWMTNNLTDGGWQSRRLGGGTNIEICNKLALPSHLPHNNQPPIEAHLPNWILMDSEAVWRYKKHILVFSGSRFFISVEMSSIRLQCIYQANSEMSLSVFSEE